MPFYKASKIRDGALAYGITHATKLLAGWGFDEVSLLVNQVEYLPLISI
jgi:hypothetical protein